MASKNGTVVKSIPTNVTALITEITGESSPVKGITHVFGTSNETELDRVRIIQQFLADGYSQREMLAAVGRANGGRAVAGFGKGTVSRYAPVAAGIKREDMPRVTPAQGKRATLALVTIANYGGASAVNAALDMAIKGTGDNGTPVAFVATLERAARDAGQAAYKDATTPVKRPVQGNANVSSKGADKGKGGQSDADKGTSRTRDNGTEALPLMSVSTARLITELSRRVASDGMSAADITAFTSLLSAVEEIATKPLSEYATA